ncbi:tyrosine-type recombinase/integrase [Mycobacterium sp. Dal123C01]|uniref:tyrosine-type recombinase/integrase n=1 Tax=Mycobacterium sp. Dal123C01 TaxID=3457577 RepID=UPI00403EF40B
MPAPPDIAALLGSWEIALKAERKSPSTIESYLIGARLFVRWCDANGHTPALDLRLAQSFLANLLDRGVQPNTARARYAALRRYAAWLYAEDELDSNTLLELKPPKIDTKLVQRLSDDDCRRLVKACKGKAFLELRDEAIARLMIETGLRAGEVLGLNVDDMDLGHGLAVVRRGKGGKARVVSFSPQAATCIERYLRRARSGHRLADTTKALWLGGGGQNLRYHGLDKAMKQRAIAAGISGFHLHLLRHTSAQRWLAAGGSEGGLMALAGWSSRDMLDRYTRATASDRAAAEAKRLDLGADL